MLNKDNVQEIERNIMTIKMFESNENKSTHKKILINQKVIMINHTKTRNKTNFLHLKMRKR